jgi:hypothetical protein
VDAPDEPITARGSSRFPQTASTRPLTRTEGRAAFDDICDALTAWHEDVRRGVVFGMPCLKKSGRVVLGFTRRTPGMVFKLVDPDAHARALALPGAHLFDPSGRGEPFKQWVVVPLDQAEEWEALAYDALHGQAPRWENQEPSSSSR